MGEHVIQDNAELPAAVPSAPRESACATTNLDYDGHHNNLDEELTHAVRLGAGIPQLGKSIRECELLSHALIAHSRVAERITGQIIEEADAIRHPILHSQL